MEFNLESSELTLKHKTLDVRLYLAHDRGAGLSHNSGGRPESWEFEVTEIRHNGRLVTPST